MEKTVTLTIAPAAWCDQAAAMLARTIRGAPCYTVDDMRAEIEQGPAALYSVTRDSGELVGYVVLRVELYQGGAEGVIVAGAGELMGAKLYGQVLPALERMFTGVSSIRVEACRRGAVRELLELGYLPTHAIMRKNVDQLQTASDSGVPNPLAPDHVLEQLQAAGGEACHRPTWRDRAPDLRSRPGKLHGGGGGSSSSSSTQSTINQDRRIVADGGGVGISADSSTVTINALDAGAIERALDFAKASDQETGKTLNQVLGLAAGVFDKAGRSVDASADRVAQAYSEARGTGTEKTVLIAAGLAVVAIVAIKVLK